VDRLPNDCVVSPREGVGAKLKLSRSEGDESGFELGAEFDEGGTGGRRREVGCEARSGGGGTELKPQPKRVKGRAKVPGGVESWKGTLQRKGKKGNTLGVQEKRIRKMDGLGTRGGAGGGGKGVYFLLGFLEAGSRGCFRRPILFSQKCRRNWKDGGLIDNYLTPLKRALAHRGESRGIF